MPKGYCVKCKAHKEVKDGIEVTMKNGSKAIKGKCPDCGAVMLKIIKKSPPPADSGPAAPPANPPNPSV